MNKCGGMLKHKVWVRQGRLGRVWPIVWGNAEAHGQAGKALDVSK